MQSISIDIGAFLKRLNDIHVSLLHEKPQKLKYSKYPQRKSNIVKTRHSKVANGNKVLEVYIEIGTNSNNSKRRKNNQVKVLGYIDIRSGSIYLPNETDVASSIYSPGAINEKGEFVRTNFDESEHFFFMMSSSSGRSVRRSKIPDRSSGKSLTLSDSSSSSVESSSSDDFYLSFK